MRKPNFANLLKVLQRGTPDRPTLFEFFLNGPLYKRLSGYDAGSYDVISWNTTVIKAYERAGYDYAPVQGSDFYFPVKETTHKASRSMSDTAIITDRESFKTYKWPDPEACDYSRLSDLAPAVPEGMRLIVWGPGGVLENVMSIMGYEPLCYALADDPKLVEAVFDEVGSRLVRYYELSSGYEVVGAMISNDDWGFNTQTMLPPDVMRKYVIPWHKKIAETIHKSGYPAILHSCGNLDAVMDDIIDVIGYDAKHSYEDKICPVEDAYERWSRRIAILGGIDLDFVCRSTPEAVYRRSKAMLERASERGSYALGTGNSVPEYVPAENYFAMISAATGEDLSRSL